ncbi:hypothetical protein [Enterovirga aerilata]|uniref:PAS domain-containing protein n=1 Tax=Enterovirga aerilata TaxID=2730920 RepID=A0A849ID48_9HYPH|nr:hypothetical protein [Enterovirga sp. DB1703]NNM75181.1 hypothetical protein [Enterovirga sp. DB1703]
MRSPFPLDQDLPSDIERVLAYWEGLKRGEATMPFADDLSLAALGEIAGKTVLIEAMDLPPRFRFAEAGDEVARRWGKHDLEGCFADEIGRGAPFDFLLAQLSATLEAGGPTLWRSEESGYSRLLLPLWGDGRVSTLLGCIA